MTAAFAPSSVFSLRSSAAGLHGSVTRVRGEASKSPIRVRGRNSRVRNRNYSGVAKQRRQAQRCRLALPAEAAPAAADEELSSRVPVTARPTVDCHKLWMLRVTIRVLQVRCNHARSRPQRTARLELSSSFLRALTLTELVHRMLVAPQEARIVGRGAAALKYYYQWQHPRHCGCRGASDQPRPPRRLASARWRVVLHVCSRRVGPVGGSAQPRRLGMGRTARV